MARLQQPLWRNLGFWAHLHFTGRLKPHWSLELCRDLLNILRDIKEQRSSSCSEKRRRKGARQGEVVTTSWSPAGKVCLMVALYLIRKV